MITHALTRLIAAASFVLSFSSSWGACSSSTIENLIDDLVQIERPAPGVAGFGLYDAFIGDDRPARFEMGVVGAAPPSVPSQMRELARCGVEAIPALMQHLNDARATRLVVGEDSANLLIQIDHPTRPMAFSINIGACDTRPQLQRFGDTHSPSKRSVLILPLSQTEEPRSKQGKLVHRKLLSGKPPKDEKGQILIVAAD
jgi:hypothetical protein